MQQTLLVGSIEYAKSISLDKKQLIWVKFKIMVEKDGSTLWKDSFTGIDDIKSSLTANDIHFYNIIEVADGLYAARVKPESLNEFNEWSSSAEELSVRTYLTVIDTETHSDMFDKDSLWQTTLIADRTLFDWFNLLKSIDSEAKV
jgi:hypothetical protein